MIATKLHRLAELGVDDPLVTVRMHQATKYVIGDDVVGVMPREDIQKSVLAVIEADIARLPVSPMLVEFNVNPTIPVRRFVLLEEASETTIRARVVTLVRRDFASVSDSDILATLTTDGVHIDRHADEREGLVAGLAVSFALLMLNVRGVEKELIEVVRLNKRRAEKRQHPIPSHTVVRIGHVYDSDGHPRGPTYGVGHKQMGIYFRPAHVRRQHYGPGNAETKVIFVAGVLCNFREEGAEHPPRMLDREVRL